MKLAMIAVHRALAERGLRSRMLLQVHDELVLEVPESELATTTELVTTRMSRVVELSVPLEVDAKAGPNWADLEPVRVKLSH
jgi:DNA polymerase-1